MNKPQISIESYQKLNRSSAVAGFISSDLNHRPLNGMHQLYIPFLFSYIHEDIASVLEELKEKGLCDDWLNQGCKHSDKE
ncbi:Derepression protein [Salmonella enterica]|nr:Derepression protein [Salmonella enterica]